MITADKPVWILVNKRSHTKHIVGVFMTERAARARMNSIFNRRDRPVEGTYEIEQHTIETVWVDGAYE